MTQLEPHFENTVDAPEAFIPNLLNLGSKGRVALPPETAQLRLFAPGSMSVIGRRGNREGFADRLDPVFIAMVVDELDHHLCLWSSYARTKYADT